MLNCQGKHLYRFRTRSRVSINLFSSVQRKTTHPEVTMPEPSMYCFCSPLSFQYHLPLAAAAPRFLVFETALDKLALVLMLREGFAEP